MATLGSEPQPFVPTLSVATLHPHHHPHHHHHHQHHQQQHQNHQQQQHHGGTGANGGAGGGGGGSSGGFNLPLNRGLERALEEAANSGGLNLSARKLKEFPRTAAPGHDLSDTVQAGERRPRSRQWARVAVCRALPDAVATRKCGLAGCSATRSLPGAGPRGRGRGPARGTAAPASAGGGRRSPGRAGVRGGAGCERGCPASHPEAAVARAVARAGTRGRAVEAGGLRRPRPLPGPARGWGPERRRPGQSPRCGRASPVLVGKLRQRWRALGRPESIRAGPRGPLRGITERSSSEAPTARRRPGFLQPRACGRRAAAIVNPSPQPLLRPSASWFHRPHGLVPTTEVPSSQ